jgi:hypothetical protein
VITEQDLQAAIAECEGQRNPNANTCIKLAAFYTIRDHLFPQEQDHFADVSNMMYSRAAEPEYESGTEFAKAVAGWSKSDLMPVVDELVTAVSVLNPRLYASFMRKLIEN